eukprot:765600-Hanusia_phi.AAC.1
MPTFSPESQVSSPPLILVCKLEPVIKITDPRSCQQYNCLSESLRSLRTTDRSCYCGRFAEACEGYKCLDHEQASSTLHDFPAILLVGRIGRIDAELRRAESQYWCQSLTAAARHSHRAGPGRVRRSPGPGDSAGQVAHLRQGEPLAHPR